MKYLIFFLLFLLACHKDEPTPPAKNTTFYGHGFSVGPLIIPRHLWLEGGRYDINYSGVVPDCSKRPDGTLLVYLDPGDYLITADASLSNTVSKTITIRGGVCNTFNLDDIEKWP